MKKLLVMLLAVAMCFVLTACGGGEEIEITTDNWQDYLEIKDELVVVEYENAFGDVTSKNVYSQVMLCLKDEYADGIISDETSLAIHFKATEYSYECSVGEDNTVELGENLVYQPIRIDETITNTTYIPNDEELFEAYKAVALLPSHSWGETAVGILEDMEIVRIEGTLVLE